MRTAYLVTGFLFPGSAKRSGGVSEDSGTHGPSDVESEGTIVSTCAGNKDLSGESDVFSIGQEETSTISISSSEEEDPDELPAPEVDKEEEAVFEAAFGSMQHKTARGSEPCTLWNWPPSLDYRPRQWPLARLSVTLESIISYIEKFQVAAAMEVLVMQAEPEKYNKELTKLAKRLTLAVALAIHLAEFVAGHLNKVACPNDVLLFDEVNVPLLHASYWVLPPIYEDLLYASSKVFKSPAAEAARAANGLVKIVCSLVNGAGQRMGKHSDANLSPAAVLAVFVCPLYFNGVAFTFFCFSAQQRLLLQGAALYLSQWLSCFYMQGWCIQAPILHCGCFQICSPRVYQSFFHQEVRYKEARCFLPIKLGGADCKHLFPAMQRNDTCVCCDFLLVNGLKLAKRQQH